jgi:hypothetical protein
MSFSRLATSTKNKKDLGALGKMQRFEWSGQNIAAAPGRPGQNLAASLIIFERVASQIFTVCFSVVRLG